MISLFKTSRWALAALSITAAAPAFAHEGPGHSHGLVSGLVHPLTGLDHLVAIIGIGLLATLGGGKLRWQIPLSFLVAMGAGGYLGLGHPIAAIETGVAVSVMGIGLWILARRAGSLQFAVPVAAMMGFVHGWAHGAGAASDSSGLLFLSGAMAATLALSSVGAAIGCKMASLPIAQRLMGGAILLAGVGVMAG